jgi:hypothetical protein
MGGDQMKWTNGLLALCSASLAVGNLVAGEWPKGVCWAIAALIWLALVVERPAADRAFLYALLTITLGIIDVMVGGAWVALGAVMFFAGGFHLRDAFAEVEAADAEAAKRIEAIHGRWQ